MIDPSSMYHLDRVRNEKGSILTFDDIPQYDHEDYDLSDTREFNKYLKDIEKSVRTSYEYREFIKYLHTYGGMYSSGVFENINGANSGIKIEVHHTPFSLYDIVRIVYDKRAFYHEDLSVEMVAKEVMELHYKRLVGLYSLTQTEHELVHKGYLFIPTYKVFGRYDLFVSLYNEFIDDELKATLSNIDEYSRVAYDEEEYKDLMKQSNVYIDTSGAYSLPILDNLKLALTDRVTQIKQNAFMLPVFEEDVITNPMDNMRDKVAIDQPIFDMNKKPMKEAIYFDDSLKGGL